jgi:hypothetical protein
MDSLACNYNPLATDMGFVLCIFPGTEVCNASDDDCNGAIDDGLVFSDWFVDQDLDGFGDVFFENNCLELISGYSFIAGDCNDSDITINPIALEIPNNDIDEDCDGDIPNEIRDLNFNQVNIFPNPSSGYIQVQGVLTPDVLEVFNAQGLLILSVRVQKNERIQLDALSNGLYVVRFGNNFVQRLILSK